ncbi:glycoside hydrolase family 127 protein [Arthrobacter sp. JZ12]|nr:glycoside hydrolase family 127 protein [Arthrobacter sp. JZ12]
MLGTWQRTNREASLRHCVEQLESSGALPNMRAAADLKDGEGGKFRGFHFADSDIYKVLEALGWEAGRSDVSEFLPFVDETVALLKSAQQDDGYLNSFYAQTPERQFSDLRWGHELYCLGHLLQAGIAWARTAGRTDLLEIGVRFAELVERTFPSGGRPPVCGHPEIETALMELYRHTGETRWLDLARRMVDERGRHSVGEDRFGYQYFQDHLPVREVPGATGHVVRQLYLAAGVADLYTEDGDEELLAALNRIWSDVHFRKMYITGGLGSRHRDEAFGDPFELPPDRAYSETCAAISSVQFNWRMLLITGESRFADELERALYNGVAGSTSATGTGYFYSNPLQVRTERDGEHEQAPAGRVPWYDCACCPPNLARLLSSLHSYTATTDDDGGLQLHLFESADIRLPNATVAVTTGYPFDGRVRVEVSGSLPSLSLRVPGWAKGYTLLFDGAERQVTHEGGYLRLSDVGSVVELVLDMPAQFHAPHPHIDASRGCLAVTRGPIVYALEQADLPDGVVIEDVVVRASEAPITGAVDAVVPGDLSVPRVTVSAAAAPPSSSDPYPVAGTAVPESGSAFDVDLVPYFRWGNRGAGGMRVWIPAG